MVTSGENMTLVCSSESAFDQFHLLKEGENLGRPLAEVRGPRGALQAEFPLGPGTPAHSGVYRCYGSFSHSPYSWSDSSDPLFLSVTGEEPFPGPCFVVPVQLLCCFQLFATPWTAARQTPLSFTISSMDHSLVVVKGPLYLREAMSQSCRATQA